MWYDTISALGCHAQAPESSAAQPPPESEARDAEFILDDGQVLRAHSVYLQHASPQLREGLAAPQKQREPSEEADSSRQTRSAPKRRRSEEAEWSCAAVLSKVAGHIHASIN